MPIELCGVVELPGEHETIPAFRRSERRPYDCERAARLFPIRRATEDFARACEDGDVHSGTPIDLERKPVALRTIVYRLVEQHHRENRFVISVLAGTQVHDGAEIVRTNIGQLAQNGSGRPGVLIDASRSPRSGNTIEQIVGRSGSQLPNGHCHTVIAGKEEPEFRAIFPVGRSWCGRAALLPINDDASRQELDAARDRNCPQTFEVTAPFAVLQCRIVTLCSKTDTRGDNHRDRTPALKTPRPRHSGRHMQLRCSMRTLCRVS